jgi:hypothetical protein
VEDAPPGGNLRAMMVLSGCKPSITLDIIKKYCRIKLRCWCKSAKGIGSVYVTYDENPGCEINFKDTIWTFYESLYTLQCESKKPIAITFTATYGNVIIDLLRVVRVD